MEVVLIDKFIVPEESKTLFLAEVRKSAASSDATRVRRGLRLRINGW